MKSKYLLPLGTVLGSLLIAVNPLPAQSTAFTYQGRLANNGSPANGGYDLTFALFDAETSGSQVGTPQTNSAVVVSNGLFTVMLEFGNQFPGANRWLEIAVRTNGSGAFTTVSPRQALTSSPYAITAGNVFGLRVANSATDAPNLIGGAGVNVVDAGVKGAVIAGGGTTNYFSTSSSNRVSADFSSVGGGTGNWIQSGADHAAIGGGLANQIGSGAHFSVLGGGWNNTILGPFSFIGGGNINVATGNYSGIGGGYQNHASSDYVTVGGGEDNTGSGLAATVGGGANNTANGAYSTVGGGLLNQSGGGEAVVGGGENNSAGSFSATVAGGYGNQATDQYATVPGGFNNLAGAQYSFAAGRQAKANHQGAFVWADSQAADFASTTTNQFNVRANGGVVFMTGGAGMTLDGQQVLTTGSATIGLSIQQNSNGAPNIVEGSSVNLVSGGVIGATIGGGGATNYFGRSYTNSVTSDFGTVGGGLNNIANGRYATVGGGEYNTAAYLATVGGGQDNSAVGFGATVGGGNGNTASAFQSTVSGGEGNHATNLFATVPGGAGNVAGGQFSFAAGRQAQALDDGAFVWADSQAVDFSSTSSNQFLIRAQGGVGIGTNNPAAQLQVTSSGNALNPQLRLDQTASGDYARVRMVSGNSGGAWDIAVGAGSPNVMNFFVANSGGAWDIAVGAGSPNVMNFFVAPSVGSAGTNILVLQPKGNATLWGTLAQGSDRAHKENIQAIDPQTVLARVSAMPITQWSYLTEPGVRHLGPMAQDFYAAFNVGPDDKHITTVDEGGVALAAIQGLNQKLAEELKQKETEITELQQRLAALEKIVLSQKSN